MISAPVLLGLLFTTTLQSDVSGQRIVAASNVRLRTAPQATAEELGRLSLGSLLSELEKSADASWIRVRTPDGRVGWVFGSLTALSQGDLNSTYRQVIEARLHQEDLSFPDAADVVEFTTRVADLLQGEARAELELLRLLALERAARQVEAYEPKDSVQSAWIQKYDSELNYSEPGGEWFVRDSRYWELEQKHRGSPLGERIAWHGANAGLPGECEGYIPCTLAVLLMTDGRYLELYPNGAHAEEAIESLDFPVREIVRPDTHYEMDPREAKELLESIGKLAQILERTSSSRKVEVLARLRLIEKTYR